MWLAVRERVGPSADKELQDQRRIASSRMHAKTKAMTRKARLADLEAMCAEQSEQCATLRVANEALRWRNQSLEFGLAALMAKLKDVRRIVESAHVAP